MDDNAQQFVAVGRAWETPAYEERLTTALNKARSKLQNLIQSNLAQISKTLVSDGAIEWDITDDDAEELLNDIAHNIAREQVETVEISKLYESLKQHEVCVMLQLEVQKVVGRYRQAVTHELTRNGTENVDSVADGGLESRIQEAFDEFSPRD